MRGITWGVLMPIAWGLATIAAVALMLLALDGGRFTVTAWSWLALAIGFGVVTVATRDY